MGSVGTCPPWCEAEAPHPGQAHTALVLHLVDRFAVQLIGDAERCYVALSTVDPDRVYELADDTAGALGRLILDLPQRDRVQLGQALISGAVALQEPS
jgi:hypothetical protein